MTSGTNLLFIKTFLNSIVLLFFPALETG